MSESITNLSQFPLKEDRDWHILTISGKTRLELVDTAEKYIDYLSKYPQINFPDFCFNVNTRQKHNTYRLAICAQTAAECLELIKKRTHNMKDTNPIKKIAFLYSGAGSQHPGMAIQLYLTNPIFRHTLNQCHEILTELLNISLIDILYSSEPRSIDDILHTQVSIFSIEVALSKLWQSWGIAPKIVMGHSLGEYAAAYKAGIFNLKDSLKLVSERGRLMQRLPENVSMLAVLANPEIIKKILKNLLDHIAIAVENSPLNTVLSGRKIFIEIAQKRLSEEGIEVQKLNIARAGHSAEMNPIIPEFRKSISEVNLSAPEIELISNLTGELITAHASSNEYWCQHLCKTVKFSKGMQTMRENNVDAFIEIGPKPILLTLGKQCLDDHQLTWVPSLYTGQQDWKILGNALSELYTKGVNIDWQKFDSGYVRQELNLSELC